MSNKKIVTKVITAGLAASMAVSPVNTYAATDDTSKQDVNVKPFSHPWNRHSLLALLPHMHPAGMPALLCQHQEMVQLHMEYIFHLFLGQYMINLVLNVLDV